MVLSTYGWSYLLSIIALGLILVFIASCNDRWGDPT